MSIFESICVCDAGALLMTISCNLKLCSILNVNYI